MDCLPTYISSINTEPLEELKNIAWLEQSENLLIGDFCVPVDLCCSDFHVANYLSFI